MTPERRPSVGCRRRQTPAKKSTPIMPRPDDIAGRGGAPPGAEAQHDPRRSHPRRDTTTDDARAETINGYLALAYSTGVMAQMGIGHGKLVRLIRAYVATRGTAEEFLGWVTSYADPTGETAVWNVLLKGQGGWST